MNHVEVSITNHIYFSEGKTESYMPLSSIPTHTRTY